MDIEGVITPTNFGDVLYFIFSQKETGVLYLKDSNTLKTIYMKNGNIVFSFSNQNDERLGEVLLREGLISIDQYYQSSRMISKNKKQGAILVEMGAVKSEDLTNAVRFQVKQNILSIFKWNTGKYVFQLKSNLDDQNLIDFQIFIPNLIMEGMRRIHSWSRIDSVLFQYPVKIRRSYSFSKAIKEIDLTQKEYRVLQKLEEPADIMDISCSFEDISSFEVCNILWRLITIRLLEKINISRKADNYKDLYPHAYKLIEKYNEFFILTYDVLGKEFGNDRDTIIKDRLDPIFKKYHDHIDKNVFYNEGFFEPRALFESIKTDKERSVILVLREIFDQILDEFMTICSSYLSKDILPDIVEKSREVQSTIEKL